MKPRHQVCISLDASLQARLDAVLPRYDRARMRRCTRAEFARTALILLIEQDERRAKAEAECSCNPAMAPCGACRE